MFLLEEQGGSCQDLGLGAVLSNWKYVFRVVCVVNIGKDCHSGRGSFQGGGALGQSLQNNTEVPAMGPGAHFWGQGEGLVKPGGRGHLNPREQSVPTYQALQMRQGTRRNCPIPSAAHFSTQVLLADFRSGKCHSLAPS